MSSILTIILTIVLMPKVIEFFDKEFDFFGNQAKEIKARAEIAEVNHRSKRVEELMGYAWENELDIFTSVLQCSLTEEYYYRYVSLDFMHQWKNCRKTREFVWINTSPCAFPIDIESKIIERNGKYDYSQVIKEMFIYCQIVMYRYGDQAHIVPAIEAVGRVLTNCSDKNWWWRKYGDTMTAWLQLYPQYPMMDEQITALQDCYRLSVYDHKPDVTIPRWLRNLWEEAKSDFYNEVSHRHSTNLPLVQYNHSEEFAKLSASIEVGSISHYKMRRDAIEIIERHK